MSKLFQIISLITILTGIGLIILIFYWLTYPYKPLVFQDEKFPIKDKVVEKGEMVTYTSNYCKYMDLPAIVTRTFKNDLIFVTPSTITNRPQGCNTIVVAVTVPKELPAGIFRMEQTYKFQVNPIRTITILEDTEDFEVIEAGTSGKAK